MPKLLPATRIPEGGMPEHALVCGDPARAERIAERLEGAKLVGSNREYVTYRGRCRGVEVSVTSHGVGAAGAMLAFQELARAGANTILRVGTCGALRDDIQEGDLIIASACIRDDGVTDQMVPSTYPAAAAPEVVLALEAACKDEGARWQRGIVWTKSLFYPGVLTPPLEPLINAGAIALEMELSSLLVLGGMLGLQAGGVLVVDGNPTKRGSAFDYDPHRKVVDDGVALSISVALAAIVRLATPSR
jgi:uridine phosphorylase